MECRSKLLHFRQQSVRLHKIAQGDIRRPVLVIGEIPFLKRDQLLAGSEALDDLQFLELGFGYNTVHPSALVVIFLEHIVQFANVPLASAHGGGFGGEAFGKGITALAEAIEIVDVALEVVNALANFEQVTCITRDARHRFVLHSK